tara:strand:- start:85 stop:384 length:300 start_codon:yes stop_codon:yes gene_type:complete
MKERVLKYFNLQLLDKWNDDCDFFVYSEDCVDGYSVTVATANPLKLVISEDIHYYQNEVPIFVADAIRAGAKKIYLEELSEIELIDEIIKELSEDLKTL